MRSSDEIGRLFNTLTILSGCLVFINFLTMQFVIGLGGPIVIIVIGLIKEILLTYAGFQCFDFKCFNSCFSDMEFTPVLTAGLAISFAGAGFWTKSKYKESFQAKQRDTTLIDYDKAKK